jgi:hypothetical protein
MAGGRWRIGPVSVVLAIAFLLAPTDQHAAAVMSTRLPNVPPIELILVSGRTLPRASVHDGWRRAPFYEPKPVGTSDHEFILWHRSDVGTVGQVVAGLETPNAAARWYASRWASFDFHNSGTRPVDHPYRSALADEIHQACVRWTFDGCYDWYYLARYGQYVVDVSYSGAAGADAEYYVAVAAIERHVQAVLATAAS